MVGLSSFRDDISGYPIPTACPQYEKPSNHQWFNPVTSAIASNNFQHPKSQLGFMAAGAQHAASTSGKVTRREKVFFFCQQVCIENTASMFHFRVGQFCLSFLIYFINQPYRGSLNCGFYDAHKHSHTLTHTHTHDWRRQRPACLTSRSHQSQKKGEK